MASHVHTTTESSNARSVLGLVRTALFYLSVLAFVFFWLLAFDFVLVASVTSWFDPVLADTIHFVHDIALATWVWVWGLAMVVQLYRPARRVTAMQAALVLTVADIGVGLPYGVLPTADAMLFFGPIFLAAALHPARDEVFGARGLSRDALDPVVLGLVGLAAIPVVLYVAGQLSLQQTLADEHAAIGHYATMGYYGLSMLGLATLAAVRTRGRRFAAYGAALMAVMLPVASVFNPTASGLSLTWSTLSVLWGLAVVGAYERRTARVAPDDSGSAEELHGTD